SCAGHPPPLLIGPTGETTWLDEATSPPLNGNVSAQARHDRQVILEAGAMVVLYSDGLIERRGEHLDLGLDRLQNAARNLMAARSARAAEPSSTHENPARNLTESLTNDQVAADDIVVAPVQWLPLSRLTR
ncbi:MAG: SpoIIE family protein phosphatase, partial [Herbiconiux sp.]|nr:SpoIIE family protein phosphatase [Herbiconiux sp.]